MKGIGENAPLGLPTTYVLVVIIVVDGRGSRGVEGAYCPVKMSAFWGERSGLGYSLWSWSMPSIRYGPPFLFGHHIDAVSMAPAILVVLVDSRLGGHVLFIVVLVRTRG
jgi:hypothetical protein